MTTKNLLAIVIAVCVIVIVGIGGYLWGVKSKVDTPVPQSVAGGAPAQGTANVDAVHAMARTAALEELQGKAKSNPNDVKALRQLADMSFELRRFEEAAEHYKSLLKHSPKDVDIYNELGISYYYINKAKDGLKYIDEGIKINPYHQRIWLTKGFVLAYGMGDLKGALAAWEKAKAIDPNSEVGNAASNYIARFSADAKK